MCTRFVRVGNGCRLSLTLEILGGEGGGHTGDIPFSILIPACVDVAKGRKSPLTGEQVMVVAAGARYFPALKNVAQARL